MTRTQLSRSNKGRKVNGQLADVLNRQHTGTRATWRINTKILSTCRGMHIVAAGRLQLVIYDTNFDGDIKLLVVGRRRGRGECGKGAMGFVNVRSMQCSRNLKVSSLKFSTKLTSCGSGSGSAPYTVSASLLHYE